MALAPPLVVTFGVIAILAVSGYWLMKPTVRENPGVAVYKPPAANVLEYGWGAKSLEVEQAANGVAEAANAKLKLEPTAIARAKSTDVVDEAWAAAKSNQKTKAARVPQRQDASRQSQPRPAQHAQPTFAQRPFRLWAN